jgi:hypothetical protein
MMLIRNGAALLRSPDAFDPEKPGKAIRRQAVAGRSPYYWEHVSTVYAYHADRYGETVETLFDSTAVTDEPHHFQVIAHTQAGKYWVSDPVSGYSVDNLAPCPPAALAGEQQHIPESLLLTWDPNTEPDLDGYAVYRGLSEDFVPGPGNLVASPCDTFTVDTGWTYDFGYFYKVSAIDVHGNESPFALLRPTSVTGDDTPSTPLADFLRQNYPNPFNPNTSIEFGVTTSGPVSLRVFDAAGHLVRVIVDESKEPGLHRVSWDGRDGSGRSVASGVYFYRIDASSFTDTRKMVLLR